MKQTQLMQCLMIVLLAVALLTLYVPTVGAQSGVYTLTWNAVGSKGGMSTGGAYALNGTIGQPDAGVVDGGMYTLTGGFWGSEALTSNIIRLFIPLIRK